MILPNFIDLSAETALYSHFGGHKGGIVTGEKGGRGSVRLQFDSPGQPWRISRATKRVLARSHSRSLQLQARLDTHSEFENLERSPKRGGEAGRARHCIIAGLEYAKYSLKKLAGLQNRRPS